MDRQTEDDTQKAGHMVKIMLLLHTLTIRGSDVAFGRILPSG